MGPRLDPFREVVDRVLRQLAFGGHLELPLVANGFQDPAFRRIAHIDDQPFIARLDQERSAIEANIAALFGWAMTGITILGEDGANLRLEKIDRLRISLCKCRAGNETGYDQGK